MSYFGLKPQEAELRVERVANGWIVRPFSHSLMRDGYLTGETSYVARTPDELSELILDWAQEQDKSNDR